MKAFVACFFTLLFFVSCMYSTDKEKEKKLKAQIKSYQKQLDSLDSRLDSISNVIMDLESVKMDSIEN